MKIAIATQDNWTRIAGHAGQARDWLVFDCPPEGSPSAPERVQLAKAQLPHHFRGDGPHPLHGVEIMVAASAGQGYVRHMGEWGARVVLTGESDPRAALDKIIAGEALADTRFDITTALCAIRDLFSRH